MMDASMFRAWVAETAQLVCEHAEHLTHLDAAIGDADHGVNLRRGFQAAVTMLDETDPATPALVLATVGRALISKTGGASGPLYGTGFRQAARALGEDFQVSPGQLGVALQAALDGIRQLGAAKQGDKTMVDALGPAVDAYRAVVDGGGDLAAATRAAADAAARGLQETVGIQARKGRASYLGPRTIGHKDPGAASAALVFQALAHATRVNPSTEAGRWAGLGVAPGRAVAASWRADRPLAATTAPIDEGQVARAFRAVAANFDRLADEARAQGRDVAADIVAVGALIARDPELVNAACHAATTDDSLHGIHDAIEAYARMLESLPDETLRERAADVRQVARRVVEHIARTASGVGVNQSKRRLVLVADELGPADLLEHLGQGLAAAVAVRGGANSHAAIIARSVGLPLVVGVSPEVLELPDDTVLLVDADAGVVVADPPHAEVADADEASVRDGRRRAALAAERARLHATADGQPFVLLCNVASDTEVRVGRQNGAEGIGLVRTELPFLHAERWPSEADHRRALRPVFAEAAGWPVTVRLLDFANDKVPPFLVAGATGSPAGLQALLDNPAALDAQLRAVMDLGHDGRLRIMVPMVNGGADVQAVRSAANAVASELGLAPPSIGAMVETRAAVEATSELCRAADFLSIGTNDLTAEVLDLDRTDPRARPELTAHPRVLALISDIVTGAHRAGRPLSVCGDAGSHPTTLPLLLGAGIRQFSVACARIDETRYRLLRLDTAACAGIFTEALGLRDADETAALIQRRIAVAVP